MVTGGQVEKMNALRKKLQTETVQQTRPWHLMELLRFRRRDGTNAELEQKEASVYVSVDQETQRKGGGANTISPVNSLFVCVLN